MSDMEDMTAPLVNSDGGYVQYTEETSADGDRGSSVSEMEAAPPAKNFSNLGVRLKERKLLIQKRRWMVDLKLGLALLGIAVMVLDTEMTFENYYDPESLPSQWLKLMITISTVILVFVNIMYHVTGAQLRMVDNGLRCWRLAVTRWNLLKLFVEIIICSIHPLPLKLNKFVWKEEEQGEAADMSAKNRLVPVSAVLSILMFLRLYLFGRFMVVHSNILIDSCVQSLGTLSQININAQFVFRALMSTNPGWVLSVIMIVVFIIGSWTMRTCEMYAEPSTDNAALTQVMWLIAVTFLTLGYGDLTPVSYCGRFIAISTGLMGVGTMALFVAVLAKKLEQTRPEKYVHTFLRRIRLDQRHKHSAADVLKQAVMVWRLKRAGFVESHPLVVRHRRKLLQATSTMKTTKELSGMVRDNTIGIIEVSNSINDLYKLTKDIKDDQRIIQNRIDSLENHILGINRYLRNLKP